MKKQLFLLLLIIPVFTFGQQETTTISFNNANRAIELTNGAINDITNNHADQAFEKLLQAIEIDSTSRNAYVYIYHAGLILEDRNIAIDVLKRANNIFKEDDELSFYCGEMYRKNNDYDNAIKEYTNAINFAKVNGEDFDLVTFYYLNRGNCYLKRNQYTQALPDYNKMLELDPGSVSGLTNRGITLYQMGEKEKAYHDWENASEMGGEYAKLYYKRYCKK